MNPKQISAWNQPRSPEGNGASPPNPDRCLTLLVEGAALAVLEIDSGSYRDFRSKIAKLAQCLPDRLPDEEKLALIGTILREFDACRAGSENALRSRLSNWRSLAEKLLRDLLASLGIDAGSPSAAPLVSKIPRLTTAEHIQ